MLKEIFDFKTYLRRQEQDALTSPLNRQATMRERSCNEEDLHEHPNWLMEHYIKFGGADAFSKRRPEFVRVIDVPDETQPEFHI